jgi:predicted PurR-regulated permease PerM
LSKLAENPSSRPWSERAQSRSLEMLATAILIALVVVALYVGRDIFIPIAIAILVSFVLSPPLRLLRRCGLGRVFSVLTIVFATLIIVMSTGTVLTRQFSELAVDLPIYQSTINAKLDDLREAVAENTFFARISSALKTVGEINPQLPPLKARGNQGQDGERPIPVEVHQPGPGFFAILQTIAGTALSPLETTGIAVIFVVFILLQREDLRNRFIRLIGARDLQRTTNAMNDAAERLSRFFLLQTLVNALFGIIVAVGLHVIGIPGPILWGIVAFMLRFVPYIGPVIAAGFPVTLAAAFDPGWGIAVETLALFVIAETLLGQAVEPWLYSHNTGVSPSAVVISATFWTWLWGPVGLVLSTPLTVCLAVLGRHVERLTFLDLIFGDTPPLTQAEIFYQRVLAGDASEVANQAERYLKHHSLADYFDGVALQALLMAQADLRRGVLDELRQRQIKDTIEELLDDLPDQWDYQATSEAAAAQGAAGPPDSSPETPGRSTEAARLLAPEQPAEHRLPVLCVAGRSLLDEAAAALFAHMLEKNGIASKVEPAAVLTIGGIQRLSGESARMVCLSYLDAEEGGASARFAVRRLCRHIPGVKILVGCWQRSPARVHEFRDETKAAFCVATFRDALDFCLKDAKAEASQLGNGR